MFSEQKQVNVNALRRSVALGYLGNSGIKFEVEGGEGSAGADTYIPLQKSFILASFFTENCDFAAFF